MKEDKSCGAVLVRIVEKKRQYLLIHQTKGHWAFPKGHPEGNETERETALREVEEETGLKIAFLNHNRYETHYNPVPDISKTVVFFVAEPLHMHCKAQEGEVEEILWLEYEEALQKLTFEADRTLLSTVERSFSC